MSELDPLFSEENYKYLYDSAMNYLRLKGIEAVIPYEPENLRDLYNAFDEAMREENVTIKENDGRLSFHLDLSYCRNTLYYIPCNILDKTEGEFRNIILEFFRILYTVNNLQSQLNSYHVKGLFQELDYDEELREEGQESELDTDYLNLLKRYREGDINVTLGFITIRPEYAPGELQDIIERYIPKNEKEKALLPVLHDGLELMLSETPIFNYVGRPDYDPDSGCDLTTADELYMIVYDLNDGITDMMIESINAVEENGCSEYFSIAQTDLTPETDELMKEDSYPKAFIDWTAKLIDELIDYDDK